MHQEVDGDQSHKKTLMKMSHLRLDQMLISVIFFTLTVVISGGCSSNRIPFEFIGGDAYIVDYDDYH